MSANATGSTRDEPRDDEVGIRCPRCHCRHMLVLWTRPRGDRSIRRRRECRHCGHQVTTTETRLSEAR